MKKPIISSLLLLLALGQANAQHITFERSYDYGFAEAAYAVIQTTDGGYLMGGRQGFAPLYSEGLLVKTDAYGIEQWHSTFWAGCDTYIHDVKELEDGGFIIVGDHCLPDMASNIFLARIDEFGDTLWLRSFGTPDGDYAREVEVLADGGFLIAATWGIPPSKGTLIRTDDEGNVIWQQFYLPEGATESVFESLSVAEDGTIYMCGTAHFPDPERENVLYVVRADSDGNLLWERWFGGPENDQGMAVAAIPGGGAYAAGYTWSFGAGHYDMYLIRLSEDGDTLWTSTFGDEFEDAVLAVVPTADGGCVLSGGSDPFGPVGSYHAAIRKIDANGEQEWEEHYSLTNLSEIHIGYGLTAADDGGFAMCGISHFSAYLIKTGADGKVVGIEVGADSGEVPSLYPNPTTDVCHIRFPAIWSGKGQLSITVLDMAGREVLTANPPLGADRVVLAVSHLRAGMYLVRVTDRSQHPLYSLKLTIR